jgi:hypothetical protein
MLNLYKRSSDPTFNLFTLGQNEKDLFSGTEGGRWLGEHSLTCPQADYDTHVLRVFLHDDGSQNLAAQQGGLETVGESIEAPVAQHSYLVVEGTAGERKL